MAAPQTALDALEQWKAETRQQIINEVGSAIMKALDRIGYQPTIGDHQELIRKPRTRKRRAKFTATLKPDFRPGTDIERVFNEIRKHPGNKGFQLQAMLAMSGHVVQERTMRTCLNRLKTRGYIVQQEKAWFPAKRFSMTEEQKDKAGQNTLL
jgi:hypothetical protein